MLEDTATDADLAVQALRDDGLVMNSPATKLTL